MDARAAVILRAGYSMAMITLKRLSELSGLSIRTVSRILRGAPHVRAEKCELVRRLAAEHHYVPNMAARNLRLQDKRFVGILLEHSELAAAVNQMNHLNNLLLDHGYCTVIGRIVPGREEECAKILQSWAGVVDYVVVLRLHREDAVAKVREAAQGLPLALVFADCAAGGEPRSVDMDRAGSVRQMFSELCRRGFRRMLHCGSIPNRLAGAAAAQKDLARKGVVIGHVAAEPNDADGYRAGAEVMAFRPEVVFFDTDRMAAGFYRYAAEHGIRIPEDISVVGFDDDDYAKMMVPPLSTLAHPARQLAEATSRIILDGAPPPAPPRLQMPFIIRGSVGKPGMR